MMKHTPPRGLRAPFGDTTAAAILSRMAAAWRACLVVLTVFAGVAGAQAATIQAGNVTVALGPTFFIDDALNGGTDTDINQPSAGGFNRNFNGLLTRNQGPTRISLTGLGFAAHPSATANDATTVTVTFTYLGPDELHGTADDVVIGTTSGTYNFTTGGEYVFAFDTPLTANLTITGTRFRTLITPTNITGNGSLKLKTSAISYEAAPTNSATLSIAGVASPVINPLRVNLAKFQTVTPGSVSGQRLAAYVTDGVVGNDNRWQSENWAYNTARIDFPFPVEVGSAQVFSGVDDTLPLASFNIQYLNGSTWTNIPGAVVTGNTNVERNLVFTNSITATSFRLIGADAPIRLRELALYPPNGPSGYPLGTDLTLNLAYQRPVVASANSAGNFAGYAVDGRTSSFMWQTTTAGTNTLDIDLRVTSKVGSVHLYSGSTGVAPLDSFVVKYWDGAAWQAFAGGTITGNTVADRVVTFTTPVSTSQVRLEFTNPGTTSIRELCVFGANTGNAGYAIGTNITDSGKIADYEDFNDAFYRITNPGSSRYIAMATGGQPALDQTGITTAQGQYQILLNVSNGTYRLRNRDTGKCLSGAQLSKTAGAALTDATYAALPHQDWILYPLGGGGYQIINQWSGLAIDTQGGATAQGTQLVQNTPSSSSTTQRWQFTYSTWSPKKGVGGTSFANTFNPGWTYNWGQKYSETLNPGIVYNPMQWGDFNWLIGSNAGPLWQYYSDWRDTSEGRYLLGFNEPDRTDQSNITLGNAIAMWPRLQALDLPLVSPAPGTPSWLTDFYTEVDRLGYRVDATAIHLYPGPSGGSSDNLFSSISSAYATASSRPVWLTEFSFVDWAGTQSWSEEDNYNTLAEFIWRAESVSQLRKYALFIFTEDASNPQPANPWQAVTPAPRSNSRDINGNLTAFGKLYAAWDSDATVRENKTYFVHNKGTRKRLANLLAAGPDGRSIRVDDLSTGWTLVSTGTANRYYIVSSRDGRRLSSNGTTVTFAAADTTGTAVEWSLTADVYGWFYIGHPASSKRLRLAYNNTTSVATYTMVATTTVDDPTKWRFIVPPASVVNDAPTLAAIAPQTVNEGTLLSFTASGTDADLPTQALSYTLIGAPSGATIVSGTGVFNWTPTEAQGPGTYNFTVRVSDGTLSADQAVSVTVNEVNIAPTLAVIAPQTVNEGTLLTFTASGTDADVPTQTLSYTLIGAPSGAAIVSGTGVFNWTPTEAQGPGTYNFTVRVSDGTLSADQAVSVTVNEVNIAPTLAVIAPQAVNEGTLLTFTASGTDADLPSQTLSYTLIGAPSGAAIVSGTGVFNWTPTEAQGPSTYNFTVRVSDGTLTADQAVSVTVNEVNIAPTLAAIAPQTVNEGTLLNFTAIGTDADVPTQTLSYTLIGAPSGAAIVSGTGVFSWTPTEAQGPGTYNFTVRVSDGTLTADQAVSVTVNEVNIAPTLAAIAPQTVNEGTLLSFTASGTDADVPTQTLSYTLIGAPSGATIVSGTGVFNWTPTEAQGPGTYNFTVRVSDGTLNADQAVSVTVNDVTPPPLAPSGVSAIPTASSVTLSWPAVANAVSYTVERSANGTDPWIVVAASITTPACMDTGLAPSTQYFYRVYATNVNAVNSPASSPVSVTTLSLYAAWTTAELGALPPADRLAGADPDGDGVSNLLEYAFGGSPTNAAINPSPTITINPATSLLSVNFMRARAELTYEIMASSDLVSWTIVGTNPGVVSAFTPVTFTDSVNMSLANPPRRFLRVKVTAP